MRYRRRLYKRALSKKEQNTLSMHDSLEAKSDMLEMGIAKFLRHGGATPEQIQIAIHYLAEAQSNMEQANELYDKVYGKRR